MFSHAHLLRNLCEMKGNAASCARTATTGSLKSGRSKLKQISSHAAAISQKQKFDPGASKYHMSNSVEYILLGDIGATKQGSRCYRMET
jgi:hypothetical protein